MIEFRQGAYHRQAPHKLRNQPEFDQVSRLCQFQNVRWRRDLVLLVVAFARDEAEALFPGAPLDDLVQSDKGAAADEQDVGSVDLNKLLVRVLSTALRRDIGNCPLQDL